MSLFEVAGPLTFASGGADPFSEQSTVTYGAEMRRDWLQATGLFRAQVDALMTELGDSIVQDAQRLSDGRIVPFGHFSGQPQPFPEDNCQYSLELARSGDPASRTVIGRFLMVHHYLPEGAALGTMQLISLQGKDETTRQYVGSLAAAGRSEVEIQAAARRRQQLVLPPVPVTANEVIKVGRSIGQLHPAFLPAVAMTEAMMGIDG